MLDLTKMPESNKNIIILSTELFIQIIKTYQDQTTTQLYQKGNNYRGSRLGVTVCRILQQNDLGT
jgi:hypothetical protein